MLENELDKLNEQAPREEVKKTSVSLAGLGKRTLCGILDFLMAILLILFFFTVLFEPVFNNIYNTREKTNNIIKYSLQTGLYVEGNAQGTLLYIDENRVEIAKKYFEEYCAIDTAENYCSVYGTTLYDVIMVEEGLNIYFEQNDNKEIIFKNEYLGDDATKVTQRQNAEDAIYGKAIIDFINNETIADLRGETTMLLIVETSLSVLAATAIIYLLVPLFMCNGKTLGKYIFKLSLTNTRGYKIKKIQIVVRYITFITINILSLVLAFIGALLMVFALLPFISMLSMMMTKKYASLHDWCASTLVVEDGPSVIYESAEKHEEYLRKEQDDYERIMRKRHELKSEKDDN